MWTSQRYGRHKTIAWRTHGACEANSKQEAVSVGLLCLRCLGSTSSIWPFGEVRRLSIPKTRPDHLVKRQ